MYIISSTTQIGFWNKEVGWTNWYHKSQLWASMWCKSFIEPLFVSFSVATLALARDQGKGVARLRAYK
jgi:hypothetical protein